MSQTDQTSNVRLQLPEIVLTQLFVDSKTLQDKLGLTSHMQQTLRREGTIIQGIHYVEVNSRLILYNLPLMIDWLANRHDPSAHTRAITHFQASLLSNRPKSKKCSSLI